MRSTVADGSLLRRLAWASGALGVALRLALYLSDRPLWFDEAYLALKIRDLALPELLASRAHFFSLPPGFTLLARLGVVAFGSSELVLRFLPLLGGLVSVPLFHLLARHVLPPAALVPATLFFAVADPLLYYSSELKPFSTDVAVALALLVAARDGVPLRRPLLVAATSLAAVALSYPAVFVLGALALRSARDAWREGDAPTRRTLAVAAVAVTGFVAAAWLLVAYPLASNRKVLEHWSPGFMPFPPTSLRDLAWLPRAVAGAIVNTAGIPFAALSLPLATVGAWSLWRERRPAATLVGLPVLLTLFASALHLYPFRGRPLLFLAPVWILLVAAGLAAAGKRHRGIGALLALVLLVPPVTQAVRAADGSGHGSELRDAIAHVRHHWQPGDKVYVYYGGTFSFEYYAPQFGFRREDYVPGRLLRGLDDRYEPELAPLAEHPRVWVLFTHVWYGDEHRVLRVLNRKGRLLDHLRLRRASLYLFGFPPSASGQGPS